VSPSKREPNSQLQSIRERWLADRRALAKSPLWGGWWRRGERDPNQLQERTPPDDLLFAQLAEYAEVTAKEDIEKLRQGVSYELDCEWLSHWNFAPIGAAEAKIILKQWKRLEQSSTEFCAALESLDDSALLFVRLAIYFSVKPPELPTRAEIVNEIKKIVMFAKASSQALTYTKDDPERPKIVGRPPGGPLSSCGPGSLPRFALRLLWDVKAAGGRLTLDKNTRQGTLVKVLNLLRPYLPPGFVPNVLPVTRLAEMKAVDAKFALDLELIDNS
jgi:hypothetical protein